ncbi:hypothetical protein MC885_017620, partial [Smutsia gigantea]
RTVDPAIEEGKLVLQDLEQSMWVHSHLGSKEHSHMLQREGPGKHQEDFGYVEEVMSGLVNVLISSVRNAQEWLMQMELHLKEEGVIQEDDYEREADEFAELGPIRH